ncbi:hypothetical protein CEB3_c03720 [Peptococcaceae bacterium CEB3]|nr:hypothetical protein CEB3_c03720 [Peptococcaceae bacterium CEB3]
MAQDEPGSLVKGIRVRKVLLPSGGGRTFFLGNFPIQFCGPIISLSLSRSKGKIGDVLHKEYPFRANGLKLWKGYEKIKERNDESVIPIDVSNGQRNRAYRIVDTILKAFRELKSSISVDRGDRDNINIILLGTRISFSLNECETKRRYLVERRTEFKPLYEMVYDGRPQINWEIYKARNSCTNSERASSSSISYIDAVDNRLEKQIPTMITELYKQCCDNEIVAHLNYKKQVLEYQLEKEEQRAKELREEQQQREQKKQANRNALINDIPAHADRWFKHESLSRYASELEASLATYADEETARLLRKYILLVRENADNCNPINYIL